MTSVFFLNFHLYEAKFKTLKNNLLGINSVCKVEENYKY